MIIKIPCISQKKMRKPQESYIDKSYEWNEWKLRQDAGDLEGWRAERIITLWLFNIAMENHHF